MFGNSLGSIIDQKFIDVFTVRNLGFESQKIRFNEDKFAKDFQFGTK